MVGVKLRCKDLHRKLTGNFAIGLSGFGWKGKPRPALQAIDPGSSGVDCRELWIRRLHPSTKIAMSLDGAEFSVKVWVMATLSHPTPPANSSVRIRPGKRNSLRQALQLQQRVFEEGTKPGVEPRDLAQLARAWDCLEDRKRILRNRPLPGSLKPEKVKPRMRPFQSESFSEI